MSIHKRVTSSGAVRWDARLRTPDGRSYMRTFRTRREAERFQATQVADRSRGTWIDPSSGRLTFTAWSEEWFRATRPRWRARTAEKHAMALRVHWAPRLGGLMLTAITPRHVQAVVNDLVQTLEPGSVRTYYGTLRACLGDAVEMDLIGRSPCRGVKLPKDTHAERRVVTPAELHLLADAVGPQWRSLVYLGGVMGLRFGEAAALRLGDVNLEAGTISVVRTLVEHNGRLEFDEPKTAAGVRSLTLPVELVDELRRHRELLELNDPADLLFGDLFGGPLRRSNFGRRVFGPAVEATGLDGLTFHGLRHSAATNWIANGLDARTVQHRLGHADPRLVLRLYAHAVTEAERRAAEQTSGIFWGQPGAAKH